MDGLEEYRKAGKIASEVREWSRGLIKPGARALDVANAIEEKIKENGAEIAFPCNVSLNEVAAHYTPYAGDTLEFSESDLVTIDLGAHIDGYIADTAYTIDLSGEHQELVEASEAALDAAIAVVKDGISVSDIGAAIEGEIKSRGFRPIENLSGHQLEQMELHAGISIPNIKVPYEKVLSKGMAFAIEPFATNGAGRVVEGNRTEIYSFIRMMPTRMREGKEIMRLAGERRGLPFPERWLSGNQLRLKMALRELTRGGALHGYPVLHEANGGLVSQAEHTLIVTEEGCEVTTR